MSMKRRLERLEVQRASEDATPWEIWEQTDDDPNAYHRDGVTLTAAQLAKREANIIQVDLIDEPTRAQREPG